MSLDTEIDRQVNRMEHGASLLQAIDECIAKAELVKSGADSVWVVGVVASMRANLSKIRDDVLDPLFAEPVPAAEYDPEVPINKSLLRAACTELRRYAVPLGADDQVVLNIESAIGVEPPAASVLPTVFVQMQRDAKRWNDLLELCGHLGDSSDVTVTLSQDDACRTQHIKVGDRRFYGSSWGQVLDKAVKGDES